MRASSRSCSYWRWPCSRSACGRNRWSTSWTRASRACSSTCCNRSCETGPMNLAISALSPAAPEALVFGMACLILLVDLVLADERRVVTYVLALATLAGAAVLTLTRPNTTTILIFGGSYVADRLGDVLKLLTYGVGAVVFVYSPRYL